MGRALTPPCPTHPNAHPRQSSPGKDWLISIVCPRSAAQKPETRHFDTPPHTPKLGKHSSIEARLHFGFTTPFHSDIEPTLAASRLGLSCPFFDQPACQHGASIYPFHLPNCPHGGSVVDS